MNLVDYRTLDSNAVQQIVKDYYAEKSIFYSDAPFVDISRLIRLFSYLTGRNDRIWADAALVKNYRVFLDPYSASHIMSYLSKDFAVAELSKTLFILTENPVLEKKHLFELNVSVDDLGKRLSEVLSSRYSIPIFTIREDIDIKNSLDLIANSFLCNYTTSRDLNYSTSEPLAISIPTFDDYNMIPEYKNRLQVNVCFDYEGGDSVRNNLLEDKSFYSFLNFSKNHISLLTPFSEDLIVEQHRPFTKEELLSVFYSNLSRMLALVSFWRLVVNMSVYKKTSKDTSFVPVKEIMVTNMIRTIANKLSNEKVLMKNKRIFGDGLSEKITPSGPLADVVIFEDLLKNMGIEFNE